MLQRVRDTPPPPRVIRPPPPPSTDIQKTFGLSRPYLSPGNNSPLSCDWIPGLKPLVSVVPIYLTPWNDIDLLVSTEHLALSRFRVPSSSSLPPFLALLLSPRWHCRGNGRIQLHRIPRKTLDEVLGRRASLDAELSNNSCIQQIQQYPVSNNWAGSGLAQCDLEGQHSVCDCDAATHRRRRP